MLRQRIENRPERMGTTATGENDRFLLAVLRSSLRPFAAEKRFCASFALGNLSIAPKSRPILCCVMLFITNKNQI